jgi:hypothetical protein
MRHHQSVGSLFRPQKMTRSLVGRNSFTHDPITHVRSQTLTARWIFLPLGNELNSLSWTIAWQRLYPVLLSVSVRSSCTVDFDSCQ